jgi:hypothetical protein
MAEAVNTHSTVLLCAPSATFTARVWFHKGRVAFLKLILFYEYERKQRSSRRSFGGNW